MTQTGAGGAIHSFSEEEKQGYVEYINTTLSGDETLAAILPINPASLDLFSAVAQGVLLWYVDCLLACVVYWALTFIK